MAAAFATKCTTVVDVAIAALFFVFFLVFFCCCWHRNFVLLSVQLAAIVLAALFGLSLIEKRESNS